uniref:hypothetical protein n=1 Tax=Daedalea confragosa TaxID=2028083 RepID=UPI002A7ED454|nr:hypothetical protein UYH48_mgp44 [Daedaleopsis confragosa]WNZ34378.1 hypothetical protein [Daedaleopsis confragosa]
MKLNNLNSLTLTQLNDYKELLTELQNESSFQIKLTNRPDRVYAGKLNSLILVISPANDIKNGSKYPFFEFIGKALYVENTFTEYINTIFVESILNSFFTNEITVIVKCSLSNSEMKVFTLNGKMFIELGYPYLGELFSDEKLGILEKTSNTLFIFDEMTWECLQILFTSHEMKLSGGSHSKRHLISLLDLRLLDCLDLLRRYTKSLSETGREFKFSNFDESSVHYREIFERLISISYHQNDSLKTVEYKKIYQNFFKLFNLLTKNKYNRKDYIEIFFLRQYKIWVQHPYLYLIRKDEYKDLFSSMNAKVEKRIDEINKGNNNSNKISTNSNNKTSSAIGKDKRGIHTLRRSGKT